MRPHSLPVRREGIILRRGQRARRREDAEIFLQLRPRVRRRKHDRDRRGLQDEPVPRRGRRRYEPRRVVGRRPEERSPPQCGMGDDGHAERGGDRKHVLLGPTVGGVVPDHQTVEQSRPCHRRGQRPLVARGADPPHRPVGLRGSQILQHAARGAEHVPLLLLLDVVEGEDVDVGGAQRREDGLQLPRRLTGRPGGELAARDHPLTFPAERRHGRRERLVVGRSLGLRAPVEEGHSPRDGIQHFVGGDRSRVVVQ